MKVINNQDEIASKINKLGLEGVSAVGDDGSVCVSVEGTTQRAWSIAKLIEGQFGHYRIGDGVQEGEIFFNNDENNVHLGLSEMANLF